MLFCYMVSHWLNEQAPLSFHFSEQSPFSFLLAAASKQSKRLLLLTTDVLVLRRHAIYRAPCRHTKKDRTFPGASSRLVSSLPCRRPFGPPRLHRKPDHQLSNVLYRIFIKWQCSSCYPCKHALRPSMMTSHDERSTGARNHFIPKSSEEIGQSPAAMS
jgi:hypothetical protein